MSQENFNSLDKLMEFGMSAAIASQMINTMNQAMRTMEMPGQMCPATGTPQTAYYIVFDGAQAGPLTEADLTTLICSDRLTRQTLVWHKGLTGWVKAETLPAINKIFLLEGK